jgi:nucleoside phosphorylase
VLLVTAATENELRGAGATPTLVCGVGPVEAAARTAAELARSKPSALLLLGVAGARAFDAPAWVVGSEAIYCDADDPRWIELRAEPDPALVAIASAALPEARVEPIGTSARVGGTQVGGTQAGGTHGCEVEAMEGYAVLRAAALAGVPAVEVRVLSNAIGEPDRSAWRIGEALEELAAGLPGLIEAVERG